MRLSLNLVEFTKILGCGKKIQVPSNTKLDTFVIFCLLVLPTALEIMKIPLLEKGFNYISSKVMSSLSKSYVFDILTPFWLQDVMKTGDLFSQGILFTRLKLIQWGNGREVATHHLSPHPDWYKAKKKRKKRRKEILNNKWNQKILWQINL